MKPSTKRELRELLQTIADVNSAWEAHNREYDNQELSLALARAIGILNGQATVVRIGLDYEPAFTETAHV